MKKLFLVVLAWLAMSCQRAAAQSPVVYNSYLGPSISSGTAGAAIEITISSGAAGIRNCLTELTVMESVDYVLTIKDAGSIIFTVALKADQGLTKEWWAGGAALCGTAASELTIDLSGTGTYYINYRGFTFR